MDNKETIEIGEYTIPEGFEAEIKDGKVIIKAKESEDERIRKSLAAYFAKFKPDDMWDADFSFGDIVAWLEKQGSQNLANSEKTCKVEPEFRVGDWVVNVISKEVEQIIDITDSEYICSGHLTISFDNQHLLKRWTIQDAKDGDVLSCENGWTCIFKALDNRTNTFSSYCFMDNDKWFCNTGCVSHTLDKAFIKAYNGEIHPATKKQRDLLFQKMKEAGYEWDAEKKELRKIEQKPAWSEEDEIGFCDAIWAIEQARTIAKNENDMGNLWYAESWLKSLKERYTWKPSEQQIGDLEYIMKHYPNIRGIVNSIYADLKKLKGE